MTFCGRGMLPIGSVGMVISKPRKDSGARQALPQLTIISHASNEAPNAAGERDRGCSGKLIEVKPFLITQADVNKNDIKTIEDLDAK
jgi:hypothetical protein